MVALFGLWAFLAGSIGCASGPVFLGVTDVTLNTQTSNGIHRMVLEGDSLKEAVSCLETNTKEIAPEEQSPDVIQEVLLMGVKDKFGERVFEVTTASNFSGNKGKSYQNGCIYRILKAPKKKKTTSGG